MCIYLDLSLTRKLREVSEVARVSKSYIQRALSRGPNNKNTLFLWYCMDRLSFFNIYVIQQATQYLMINFIRNIQ